MGIVGLYQNKLHWTESFLLKVQENQSFSATAASATLHNTDLDHSERTRCFCGWGHDLFAASLGIYLWWPVLEPDCVYPHQTSHERKRN